MSKLTPMERLAYFGIAALIALGSIEWLLSSAHDDWSLFAWPI